ncbi:hypothetical protein [Virgibacillus alimentarius]|uniref:hypothetical protein n=1 Tax=Virgibacillus alimentarius TaxID=698769 RepID=UPI0004939DA6|nr:hypothetical protein [Virgibacillus alimentarius]
MSKKAIILLVIAAFVLGGIVTGSVLFLNNKNIAQDESSKGNETQKEEVKETVVEQFGYETDEILTRDEIADEVNRIRNELEDEENEEVTEDDISEVLGDEFGRVNSLAYESGKMMDEGVEDPEKRQILTDLYSYDNNLNMMSVRDVVNPIQSGEHGNFERDANREINKLYSDYFEGVASELSQFTKDTKGFRDYDGINIGYPAVFASTNEIEGEPALSIILPILIKEDVKQKDMDKFIDKYKSIEVNGKHLGDDIEDDFFFDEEYGYLANEDKIKKNPYLVENTYILARVDVPFSDLYEGDYPEVKETENLYRVFRQTGDENMDIDENPTITINGDDIELDKLLNVFQVEQDEAFEIVPKVLEQ